MGLDATAVLNALAASAQKPLVQPATGRGPGKVSITHNEIMDYLMMNPTTSLGDVAAHFGYTRGWLSQIIHSDAFQTLLKEKKQFAFHHTVLSVREKMENVAHKALDALDRSLDDEKDASTLADVASDMLDRLGFGSKTPPASPAASVHVTVLAGELRQAQALIHQRPQAAIGVGLGNGVTLLPSSTPDVGEARVVATVPAAGSSGPAGEGGPEVRGEGS